MKKYLYLINYPTYEKEIALLEIRRVFGLTTDLKSFISEKSISPSDSAFIKSRLHIIYEKEDFDEIILELEKNPIREDFFKVEYMRGVSTDISYEERLSKVKEISLKIIGEPKMSAPNVLYGLAYFDKKWIFGIYEKNSFLWNNHIDKPFSYSQSIGVKLAKALLNIATCGDKSKKIVDTCSGVGTIVLEALFMNLDISAYEINPIIAKDANNNLIHYNYKPIVKNMDMHSIIEKYNISILDLPYGIFSHITKSEQQNLISKTFEISDTLILVTFEDLEQMAIEAGFKIVDKCIVPKGKFKRHIFVCEKLVEQTVGEHVMIKYE